MYGGYRYSRYPVSYTHLGATDTAEQVQNQLEQTHAIQDKVDEVATAVEEIGNSMTPVSYTHLDVYKRQV